MEHGRIVLGTLAGTLVLLACNGPMEEVATVSDFGLDSTSYRKELDDARLAVMGGELMTSDSLARLVVAGSSAPKRSKQLMMAYSTLGHVKQAERELDSAYDYFEQSLRIAERYEQDLHVAIALNNMATVMQDKGDYEMALLHLLRSRDLRRVIGDSAGLAKSWNNLGILLTRKNDTLAAMEAFRTAMAINERSGDSSSWSKSLANRAVIEMDMQRFDTAMVLLQRAREVRPRNAFGRSMAYLATNMGLAQEGLGRMGDAKRSYEQAIQEAIADEDFVTQAATRHYLADLLIREGDHRLARSHLDTSISLARSNEALEDVKEAHLSFARSFEATGEFQQAYRHYRAYHALADSLMNADKDRTMSELLVKNEVERTRRENAALRASEEVAQAETRAHRWQAAIAVVLSFALAIVAWALYQRARGRARFREAELEQQALRLQMDPHFLFNALNTIPGLYASTDSRTATAYVGHLSNLLRLILETSRKVQVPLRQELELLEHYLHVSVSRHPDIFSYAIHVDPTIDADTVTIPPMLLQPLVENAILHGLVPRKQGGILEVDISRVNGTLTSRVRDNGVGRAASARAKGTAIDGSRGIAITAERMRQHNRGRTAPDGLRILDLHDDRGRSTGTEVVVRTVINEAWS